MRAERTLTETIEQHTPTPNVELDPEYRVPTLGTKAGVLKAVRQIANATVHGLIDPKQATAVGYLLQVALSSHTGPATAGVAEKRDAGSRSRSRKQVTR